MSVQLHGQSLGRRGRRAAPERPGDGDALRSDARPCRGGDRGSAVRSTGYRGTSTTSSSRSRRRSATVLGPGCASGRGRSNRRHGGRDLGAERPARRPRHGDPRLGFDGSKQIAAKCLAIQKTVVDEPPQGDRDDPGRPAPVRRSASSSPTTSPSGTSRSRDLLSRRSGRDRDGSGWLRASTSTTGMGFRRARSTAPWIESQDPGYLVHGHVRRRATETEVGGQRLTFNLSGAMTALNPSSCRSRRRGRATASAILTGGLAVPNSGNGGAAFGSITFYARVLDSFKYPHQFRDDRNVDKFDPLNNCVTIRDRVIKNYPLRSRRSSRRRRARSQRTTARRRSGSRTACSPRRSSPRTEARHSVPTGSRRATRSRTSSPTTSPPATRRPSRSTTGRRSR